ncbi:MAG: hypothetical protein E6J20_04070 [Chloroflexi bacterium]|nr:MAG: hypothetical protein E6J20_04070 [Chloroflexota bacterium]
MVVAVAVGPQACLGWFAQRGMDIGNLSATRITLLQTALAIIGGLWALYLYQTSRTGQTTVSTVPNCWLAQSLVDDFWVFVVRTKVTNVSKVLCRSVRAKITVMDATIRDPNTGQFALPAFAEQDLWAVLNPPSEDLDPEFELEPGEVVTSEAAFLLSRRSLLAVRVAIDGKQGPFRREFEWNTLFFVDTAALTPQAHGLPQPG